MNTNQIKSFAQKARIILLTGVESRLRYWGFKASGGHGQAPEAVTGGYTYVGQVYDDPTVPSKWRLIADRCTSAQSYADIKEDAAYTWFNRLMVLRILEANGYIPPTLAFVPGTQTPYILQQAKLGQHNLTTTTLKSKLTTFLTEHQDEQALSLLLMHTFNTMPVLRTIFGDVSAYMDLLLPVNILAADGLLAMINDPSAIDPSAYHEVELIGWLYQFYISDKKDEVFAGFKANKKARAEDIPAATQIFTPKWIVRYMVENTLGKLYLDMEPTSRLEQGMKYLVKSSSPESESMVSPITSMSNLTLIDPASGSGHILVVGFELLMEMYLEQGYTRKAAVISILQHNLYGLDIDDRAAQLARLAVLLKAAQYYTDILQETDHTTVHIHAFPSPQHFTGDEIKGFVGVDRLDVSDALQKALDLLYHGKNIGSALQLTLTPEQRTIIVEQYTRWTEDAASGRLDAFGGLFWQRLRPYLDVLLILTKQYAAVVANPPYMGQKNMNATLKDYVNVKYPKSKSDLYAVFMESMIDMTLPDCRMGCITMESWMFLSSYENLRLSILDQYSIVSLAHFGWHIIGIAFGTATLILEKSKKIDLGEYSYLTMDGINRELNEPYSFPIKENKRFAIITQSNFSKIPGSPIAYWVSERLLQLFKNHRLEEFCEFKEGLTTANNDLFLKYWFEIEFKSIAHPTSKSNHKWVPYNKGGTFRKWYGNRLFVIDWTDDGNKIKQYPGSSFRNARYQLKEGGTFSALSSNSLSARYSEKGFAFDSKGTMFFSDLHLKTIMAFLNSSVCAEMLLIVCPTMDFRFGTIQKLPFLFNNEINIDSLIQISKEDWNSKETSWDFEQSPLINSTSTLAIAYQKWQAQVTEDFFQLHANEEELNRIFIDIYGLQDELTPEVALRDITILQDELDSKDLDAIEKVFRTQGKAEVTLPIKREVVMSQFISYCIGIMMGRYKLDKPGLHIAHPDPVVEELMDYTYQDHTIQIDQDAIIPLMGDDGAFTDDALVRLRHLLTAIWGEDTLTENINFLQDSLNTSLHRWLTEQFWPYHCAMYKKKPIYWLFCSDPKKPAKSAFRVLVYMHRMDRFTIQTIRNKYLHPHQEYLQHQHDTLQRNESSLTTHEIKKMETLSRQIIECRQYDDALKHLANQQITFDLDDGVDRNIALFDGIVATIK
ncbi:MAG: BREX-1 system adenine-specific DNA-methyltransferase PglX [Saprospiraceae bacterium]|nr:BREX-1 system adenine-specific DNA-methyltransferase PglX [Saprospiraceae bacterium]MBP6565687.1 BREX-1 system adenine-specific DNA-methyltransferase PglX [Saprospiraceae bacterium]